jgi:type I restriction enzyme, S subunit
MVPDGWTIECLGDHVNIHSGFAPASLDITGAGNVPYVKVDDLNNCTRIQRLSKARANFGGRKVPTSTVIFPKRGAAIMNNKVRVTGVEMILDTNMMGLEVKPSLDPWFTFYRLVYEKLFKIADTSTIPQIKEPLIK